MSNRRKQVLEITIRVGLYAALAIDCLIVMMVLAQMQAENYDEYINAALICMLLVGCNACLLVCRYVVARRLQMRASLFATLIHILLLLLLLFTVDMGSFSGGPLPPNRFGW